MEHYKNYIGQYGKRFYAPFKAEKIFYLKDHRISKYGIDEFLYQPLTEGESWWADCEDTCIITNELPVKDIDWVANVHSDYYKGYNPFTKQIQE